MNNKFKVKVNNSLKFNISNNDVSKLDVIKTIDNKYHILQNHKPFKAKLVHSNFKRKKYTIVVNRHTYNVDISNPLDILIDEMGFTYGTIKHINLINAPMPGLILDVHVEEGQKVKEGEPLLILEAMKMENVIVSPRDGIIKYINIDKDDAIEKGHLLIEFE